MAKKRKSGKSGGKDSGPWSYSAGEAPHTVRVYEKRIGGPLHARAWDPVAKRQVSTPLHHRDRERARKFAENEARALREGLKAAKQLATGPVTVERVMKLYLAQRTAARTNTETRADDHRRAGLWSALHGARSVRTLGRAEWDAFKAARGSGAIDAHGSKVREKDRVPVGERTIAADLKFARTVFAWAMTWNLPDGSLLLERNPWAATDALVLPKNRAPKRPRRTHADYVKIRAASDQVLMQVRADVVKRCPDAFPGARLVTLGVRKHGRTHRMGANRRWLAPSFLGDVLEILEQTGRRVGAVLDLRADDLRVSNGRVVTIRWRPVKHDTNAKVVPVPLELRPPLERALARVRALGVIVPTAPLFPSFRDVVVPVTREVVQEWYREAERLAGVPHLEGGTFHPFRRKWAQERRHLPDLDVAAIGGWKRIEVMRDSYQTADEAMALTILSDARREGGEASNVGLQAGLDGGQS